MLRATKKPPPANKRHTKPCKYFQLGSCSLSAEGCNFAHVLLPNPLMGKGAAICRFYTTGACHNGTYCPYKHAGEGESPYQPRVHIAGQEPRIEWNPLSSPVDHVYLDGPYGSYPSYTGYHQDWTYAAGPNGPPPPGYPSNYIPASKGPPIGSKPSSEFAPPPSQSFGVNRGQSYFTSRTNSGSTTNTITTSSSTRSDDLDATSNTGSSSFSSSSTDSEVELIVATTEDPKYAEHAHEHQSRVIITDQPTAQHVPPFAVNYGVRMGMAGGPVGGYNVQRPPSAGHKSHRGGSTPGNSRSASRNSNRKPSKYKTKPCKFWAANRTCAAGNDCTFRHDEPMPALPPHYSATPRDNNASVSAVEAPKPTRVTQKENYFPISWRVIGGGVLVGNKSGSTVGDGESIPSVPASPSESAPPPPAPATEKKTAAAPLSLPRIETPTRKRSNSIPMTPSSSQVVVGNLFSAESPGVL